MSLLSSDEDDFEKGDNQQEKGDDIDIEDEHGFINIVQNEKAANKENDDSENEEMSLQQKQNLFVRLFMINHVDNQLGTNEHL